MGIKKKIEIDEKLLEKVDIAYPDMSLTYLIDKLLWALVNNTEKPFSHVLQKAAKDAREEISLSSEI